MTRLTLPFGVKRPILACGADLKGAFALAKGRYAYLFDGFGDLSDLNNFTKYEKAVKAAESKLKISPKIIVCDLHPGYFSTRFAESYQSTAISRQLYRVQHHEAHIASAIIDNGIAGDVLGAAFDGTGYGLDGNIWGGEFFAGNSKSLKRVAHLEYVPMPGGEMCIKEPWRMAVSYLYEAYGNDFLKLPIDFVKKLDKKKCSVLMGMTDKKINSPITSSAGRLFDAIGSILLGKNVARFEAQLPIELEKIAVGSDGYYDISGTSGMIKGIVGDIKKKTAASIISGKFHNTIAVMILSMAKKYKMKKVVLSGGVFQNKLLKERAIMLLKGKGFRVYTHLRVPTNDLGIPLGQIAIANARVSCA
ncbi:MAG: hypothetical protein Q7S30_03210 [Candidatus Omnitrophota bacterium]|nr:hypothetical protein [Candidatus Omnitrophota bacterium]